MIDFAAWIAAVNTGDCHPKKTVLLATGAEAVKDAVTRAPRQVGRRCLPRGGAFLGLTFMGMSLTGKVEPDKKSIESVMIDIYHIPFSAALQEISSDGSFAALEKLFRSDLNPQRSAVIIIEPVQGEGGFYPAQIECMQHLRK